MSKHVLTRRQAKSARIVVQSWYHRDGFKLDGVWFDYATLDMSLSQGDSRVTVTRLALVGVFALWAKKASFVVTFTSPEGYQKHITVSGSRAKLAVQMAEDINNGRVRLAR